jgi:hypothetical protein
MSNLAARANAAGSGPVDACQTDAHWAKAPVSRRQFGEAHH